MQLTPLSAISPVDGRYRKVTEALAAYFSEFALIRYRVEVEIEYFISLAELPVPQLAGKLTETNKSALRNLYLNFTEADAQRIKDTEKVTNHDVKAVEYFIKEELDKIGLSELKEFVHFGLTSQDINNTAIPLSIKRAINEHYIPQLNSIIDLLLQYANDWKNIPLLARTHGQPASPTRLGKEVYVFAERLNIQKNQLVQIPFSAKFGGATGNFNAHHVAYPANNWQQFGNQFVNEVLGLSRSQTTTQIEHYDNLAALFDCLKRINTIQIDLCRDMWTYISMDYFKQKVNKNEVGSSAMPHKVNPIDFENAEGNFGIANAIFEHLSAKLPISRLQRDLTDSTVLRNVGVPLAHTAISFASLLKGLNKLLLNEAKIKEDLENNWAVVAEAIQTVLRRENYPQPYEALKALTRGADKIDGALIATFIDSLQVSDAVKTELRAITPYNYTGV
ncbi:MAG: adenylosuccinate lyase [Bacteroidia bacterium]|nr:adenylosuccinate lyase [Bacteroidia bacterium]MBP7261659.1 adenylosuccinate lyase [Bacteroidia bacterium]MBP9179024.1 adenylosuccinate lyase [Bacteroidia bacterium]MBP9725428.1 adenylosuccinate lyase [Bacteroidia bacterium]